MTIKDEKLKHFEVIVLGDGAGAGLARNLAAFGKKTALIGEGRPGGTCLNRGCIPSKKLIVPIFKVHSAIHTLRSYKREEELVDDSLSGGVCEFISFKDLKKEVLQEITQDSLSSKQNMQEGTIENLTYFSSYTRFSDDKRLQLEDGTQLTYDIVVVATGSSPRVPQEIKGIDTIVYDTSTQALFSQDDIDEYTILGGGVIACELGALYAACGVKVTLFATGKILKMTEDGLKSQIEKYLRELGITIHKKITFEEVSKDEQELITIEYTQEKLSQRHTTQRVLVALGVTPNTYDIGLEHTSIKRDSEGFIEVDENYKVSKNRYAIGDCTGKSLLRHGAGFEAREVFKQIVLHKKSSLNQLYMPYGIYLGEKEVAGCGKTSQELVKEQVQFKTYSKKFEHTVYGRAKGLTGSVHIHYDEHSFEVLGSHIFGADAVNLNQIIVPYIEYKKTLFDIANTICPHPSLAEGLFTIGIREVIYDNWKKSKQK